MIKSFVLLFKLLDKARDKTQLHLPAAFDLSGFEIKYSPCNRHNCVLVKTASPGSAITWVFGAPSTQHLKNKKPQKWLRPLWFRCTTSKGWSSHQVLSYLQGRGKSPCLLGARGLKNTRGPGQGRAGDLCPSRDTAQMLARATMKLFLHLSNLLPPPSSEDPSLCSLPPKCLCNSCE